MPVAAQCLAAFRAGRYGQPGPAGRDAEVGAILEAEFYALVRSALTRK